MPAPLESARNRVLAGAALVCVIVVAIVVALLAVSSGDDDETGGPVAGGRDGDAGNGSNGDSDGTGGPTDVLTTPAPTAAAVEFVAAPAGFSAPVLGSVLSECTAAGDADAALTWRPSTAAQEQEVNLLLGGQNFGPGNYVSSGGIDSDVSQTVLSGLRPAAVYFWRINTRIDGDWIAGEPQSFETARCPPPDQAP